MYIHQCKCIGLRCISPKKKKNFCLICISFDVQPIHTKLYDSFDFFDGHGSKKKRETKVNIKRELEISSWTACHFILITRYLQKPNTAHSCCICFVIHDLCHQFSVRVRCVNLPRVNLQSAAFYSVSVNCSTEILNAWLVRMEKEKKNILNECFLMCSPTIQYSE